MLFKVALLLSCSCGTALHIAKTEGPYNQLPKTHAALQARSSCVTQVFKLVGKLIIFLIALEEGNDKYVNFGKIGEATGSSIVYQALPSIKSFMYKAETAVALFSEITQASGKCMKVWTKGNMNKFLKLFGVKCPKEEVNRCESDPKKCPKDWSENKCSFQITLCKSYMSDIYEGAFGSAHAAIWMDEVFRDKYILGKNTCVRAQSKAVFEGINAAAAVFNFGLGSLTLQDTPKEKDGLPNPAYKANYVQYWVLKRTMFALTLSFTFHILDAQASCKQFWTDMVKQKKQLSDTAKENLKASSTLKLIAKMWNAWSGYSFFKNKGCAGSLWKPIDGVGYDPEDFIEDIQRARAMKTAGVTQELMNPLPDKDILDKHKTALGKQD